MEESYGTAHGYRVGEVAIVADIAGETIEVSPIKEFPYINGIGNISAIWSHKKSSWEKVK